MFPRHPSWTQLHLQLVFWAQVATSPKSSSWASQELTSQTRSWPWVPGGLAAPQMPCAPIWKPAGSGLGSLWDLCRHGFLFKQPGDQDLVHSEVSDRTSDCASVCAQTLTWCLLFVKKEKWRWQGAPELGHVLQRPQLLSWSLSLYLGSFPSVSFSLEPTPISSISSPGGSSIPSLLTQRPLSPWSPHQRLRPALCLHPESLSSHWNLRQRSQAHTVCGLWKLLGCLGQDDAFPNPLRMPLGLRLSPGVPGTNHLLPACWSLF